MPSKVLKYRRGRKGKRVEGQGGRFNLLLFLCVFVTTCGNLPQISRSIFFGCLTPKKGGKPKGASKGEGRRKGVPSVRTLHT